MDQNIACVGGGNGVLVFALNCAFDRNEGCGASEHVLGGDSGSANLEWGVGLGPFPGSLSKTAR